MSEPILEKMEEGKTNQEILNMNIISRRGETVKPRYIRIIRAKYNKKHNINTYRLTPYPEEEIEEKEIPRLVEWYLKNINNNPLTKQIMRYIDTCKIKVTMKDGSTLTTRRLLHRIVESGLFEENRCAKGIRWRMP